MPSSSAPTAQLRRGIPAEAIGQSVLFEASRFDLLAAEMAVNMENVGAKYPATFFDADGDYLSGDQNYKLHVPKHVPVALFDGPKNAFFDQTWKLNDIEKVK